ncbi:MAG: hypothetical protein EBQ92_03820 [Proteobacteria bacterium]|nr:hypothetical protein [Pseudomonadota bacterium]
MNLKLTALSFLAVCGLAIANTSPNAPKTVETALTKAYIPLGFDDNDRIQIAVAGTFKNTCYKVGPHALKVDAENKTITVQQQAYLYSGVCLQMLVPYSEIVDVGIIPSGNYKVIDAQSGKALAELPVNVGTSAGPDDFTYAPVSDAYVVKDEETGKHMLAIAGSFGDRCSDFQEIKVNVANDVIIVQPVLERKADISCAPEKVRFLKTIELNDNVKNGVYMLHVRSLNGQAINKLVDLE